ncbi:MAG: RnfABCDGE type electron transport complex subunit D, partial [Candidatus Margulisiibacteriota bacterium]
APVAYIGTVIILTFLLGHDPIFGILSGGLMLGAFFMATDYVTTPVTPKGRFIFGLGCGIITVLIRYFGGFPEGVNYSILFMNALTPLIDKYVHPRLYGGKRL